MWGDVKTFVPANTALNKDTIPDLALWLDATDINGDGNTDSISDGTALASWVDKSNAPTISVAQATSASQPLYKTGIFGTKPGVRFDGANDFLAAAPVRTTAGGYHVFVASQRPNSGLGDNSGGYLIKEAAWNLSPGSGNGQYVSFVSKQSAESGATLTNIKLGRDTANSSYDFGGDMGEVMIFTRKLGLTEEQMVEGYLAHKWGGTAALASDHPYKDVAPVFDNSPKLTPVLGQVGYDTVTRDGLLGEWLFDDNDTANAIADTSGNGYNGTNVGGTFTSDTPLGTGHSLNFFGGNNYAWVTTGGSETVFGNDEAFTVAIWYKRLPDGDWESLISKRGESNGGWKIAKMSTTDMYFYTRGTSGGMDPRTSNASTSITPADNQWHHIAVVHGYQGVKQRMYFDGVLIDEQSRSGTIQASNGRVLAFGARDDGTTNGAIQGGAYAKTHIDDARYYNRALEGYEIQAMTIRSNKLVAYVDTPYSYQIPATQGPTSWTTNGTLASKGLSLSNTGLVSGTPNAAGEFSFPITVANSEGNMTRTYQMNVKKGTRDLTWGQTIAGLTYGDANFTLSATSTNSGGITYASSDESIIEINGTSKTQHTLEDGLVWYWNFDNDQNGSSNAVNATIGGMNGTKGSGVTVVNGKFGNALNFDGSTNANSLLILVRVHGLVLMVSSRYPSGSRERVVTVDTVES